MALRLGRTHPDPANAPRSGGSALLDGPSDGELGVYDTEQEQVTELRALLHPHFFPARMRNLRSRVEALSDRLVDELADSGPPADLAAMMALPLPRLVICELLGIPLRDRDALTKWTEAIGDARDRERSRRGQAELYAYGRKLVAHKRVHPGEDVVSALSADESLSDEKAAQIAMGVLFAGYETTVAALSAGLPLLLSQPDQWQALRADSGLAASAAEESLRVVTRLLPPDIRYTRERLDIGGATIQAGELVLLNLNAANHDDTVCPDPDRFDITRKNTAHLSFGYGRRYCIGAPLARVELQTAFSQLANRFPRMGLTVPCDELVVRQGSFAALPDTIPVTW